MNLPRLLGPATGVPGRPVAVLTCCGAGLLLVAAVWSGTRVASAAVTLGIPLMAGGTAYVLDEAASEAVAAAATSLRARTVARLVVALVVVGLGGMAVGVVALRRGSGATLGISAQLAGLTFVAVAAAAALRRRVPEPGEAVAGGLLVLVVALALARPLDRWVDLFPSEAGQRWGGSLVLWGMVIALSVIALWASTRDPLD